MDAPEPTTPPAPRARTYRGLDPAARRAERRERLLAATLELSAAKGFARTTIQDICRQASVTSAHFYDEFPSREELLKALYIEQMNTTTDAVVAALDGLPADVSTMIRVGLGAYIHSMLDDPRRAHVILFEVFALPEGVQIGESTVNAFISLLEGYGAMLIAAGQLPDANAHATAVAMSGAVKELMIDWLRSDPRPPVDSMVAQAISTFRRLVQLPDPEPT